MSPEDIAELRASGVSDPAIREALGVLLAFATMDRIADALDFELKDERGLWWTRKILLNLDYRGGSIR